MSTEDNNIIKKKRSEIETKYVSRTTIKQFNEAKLYSKGFIYLDIWFVSSGFRSFIRINKKNRPMTLEDLVKHADKVQFF